MSMSMSMSIFDWSVFHLVYLNFLKMLTANRWLTSLMTYYPLPCQLSENYIAVKVC